MKVGKYIIPGTTQTYSLCAGFCFQVSFTSESRTFLLFKMHVGLMSLRILTMHETVSAVGDKCLHRRSPVHLSNPPPHTHTISDRLEASVHTIVCLIIHEPISIAD